MTARRFMPYPAVKADVAQLGYNAISTFTDLDALDAIAAGGASFVRAQPAWSLVENYATGALALPAGWEAALAHCASIGLKPVLVAGYGPPYVTLTTVTLTAPVAPGVKVLPVSGALASIDPPFCHIDDLTNGMFVPDDGRWAYYGALIDSVQTGAGTVTLAAATNRTLASGTVLTVRRLRFATLPDVDASRSEVTAFIRYAKFIAGRIVANGCTGLVELWNEMPWAHDRWDNRAAFYDTPPGGLVSDDRGSALVNAALAVTDLPAGVRFINGMSAKTGFSGLTVNLTPTPAQLAVVTADVIHPYGDRPEHYGWDPTSTDDELGPNWYELVNPADGGNWQFMAKQNADYGAANSGVRPAITATECGCFSADDDRQAVYLLRRVASLWGLGILPMIYALGEGNDFDVTTPGTYAPRPAYTALSRLLTLVASLGGAGGTPRALPSVIACPDDKYPAILVGVYGATGGLLLAWRRTHPIAGSWLAMAPVTTTTALKFAMAAGYSIAEAIDVLTGDPVVPSVEGGVMTLDVSESVIAVRLA